jgi:hypothetical protein
MTGFRYIRLIFCLHITLQNQLVHFFQKVDNVTCSGINLTTVKTRSMLTDVHLDRSGYHHYVFTCHNQWSKIHVHRYVTGHTCNFFDICHISNTKYSGTFLIRRTKEPGKCVGLYRMSEYSGLIYLTEILWLQAELCTYAYQEIMCQILQSCQKSILYFYAFLIIKMT